VPQEPTITTRRDGWTADGEPAPKAVPQLVMVMSCEDPRAASSRHLLDDVDEVRFGRAERSVRRFVEGERRVLELRLPDRRMSSQHGRLARGPLGWFLDDPSSKNGTVVDGTVRRLGGIGDGTVLELGHTLFVFRTAVVESGAASDVQEGDLPAAAPPLRTFDGALAERYATLERVAARKVSVLLQGETGTGKELVARAVHTLSGRSGAFVAVNCGALPPNLIEAELFGHRRGAFTGAHVERLGLVRAADGGTLFLDEVGELPATSQAAFLRVLQEHEVVPVGVDHPIKVDIRLCAATLRDLEALVAAGRFRRDLYARLFGLTTELSPLRERRVDLGLLTRRLLATIPGGESVRFAPMAMRAMLRHSWPLNIRELEKVLATAVALATDGVIEAAHLPLAPRLCALGEDGDRAREPDLVATRIDGGHGNGSHGAARNGVAAGVGGGGGRGGTEHADDPLRSRLIEMLTLHEGNVNAVSKALNTRRTQVYRWLDRFGLRPDAFRPPRAGS
jgi:DNA-binding NtrC family response regulator